MKYALNNKTLNLGQLVEDYGDVSIYFEESHAGKKVFSCQKANKVILALHSPYFHRLFQSNKTASVFHVCFVGVRPFAIVDVMKLIYGQNIYVKEANIGRFENFLKLLEIEFTKDGESASDASNSKKVTLSGPETTATGTQHESESPPPIMAPPVVQKRSTQPKTEESAKSTACPDEPPKRSRRSRTPQEDEEDIYEYLETITVTTQTGLVEELEKIDFKLVPSASKKKHDEYVCCHCAIRLKALSDAKSHFISDHQRTEEEVKILKESILYNDAVGKEITFLQQSLQGDDFNKLMVLSQLETKVQDLERRVEVLKNLKEKNLAPHHMRKRDYLLDMFTKKITRVNNFIKIVDE